MNLGTVLLVGLLVGCVSTFVLLGIGTARLAARGFTERWLRPRQFEAVAGSMHRVPVYPGEDDPIRTDEELEALDAAAAAKP